MDIEPAASKADQLSYAPTYELRPRHLRLLASLSPPSPARTWQTAPHPSLPLAATASSDKTARVYSLHNFSLLEAVGGGHRRSVRAVGWKPYLEKYPERGRAGGKVGAVLATGSFDASCGIWRRKYPARIARATDGHGSKQGDRSEAEGYEEDEVVDEDEDEDEEDEYQFSVLLDGHDSEIKSVAFSPVAPLLATSSRDKSVWIWEDSSTPESVGWGGQEDNFETVAVLSEHDGDVKCVCWHPAEPLLASASYDETVRLWREDDDGHGEDWMECCVIRGHDGTVWSVAWEGTQYSNSDEETDEIDVSAYAKRFPSPYPLATPEKGPENQAKASWYAARCAAGPRLLTSSDDLTVRVWSRFVPPTEPGSGAGDDQQQQQRFGARDVPSILQRDRPDNEDDWRLEATLPRIHDRAVYAAAWSARSGRVASCGGDGRVVVYEERWRTSKAALPQSEGSSEDVAMPDVQNGDEAAGVNPGEKATEWVVIAELEAAHGVYEINHVCWSRRWDAGRNRGESSSGAIVDVEEEVLITTGDEGEIKVWTLENGPEE